MAENQTLFRMLQNYSMKKRFKLYIHWLPNSQKSPALTLSYVNSVEEPWTWLTKLDRALHRDFVPVPDILGPYGSKKAVGGPQRVIGAVVTHCTEKPRVAQAAAVPENLTLFVI